jgi:hypothetical protein
LVRWSSAVQLSYPWISQLPPMQGFAGAGTLSAFLYGGKFIGHTGPSVIHGLGFVVFGMLMGRIWQSRPGREFLLSGPGIQGTNGRLRPARLRRWPGSGCRM